MELKEKLEILADAAKYDVSCSSSGSNRKNNGGLGDAAVSGICHSWSADGRCISLLKILFTNKCIYNCEYCINRRDSDIRRAEFTPREVAELTINFYKRNYIEGLFLSSGVVKSPDYTMELLIKTAEILRYEMDFNGYIHMKAIPGSSPILIKKLGTLIDRMSINIELPTERSLSLLAPQKTYNDIYKPMNEVKEELAIYKADKSKFKNTPKFVPAGQTTQMIVGASKETDKIVIDRAQSLYDNYSLKRVYYSAFIPVVKSRFTMGIDRAPLMREHRIYQADFLMRFYGFRSNEILSDKNQNFDLRIDPKANWAIDNIEKFPLEINKASYNELIKVPGIGRIYASRIINARKYSKLTYDSLSTLKISTKRARHFILVDGKYKGINYNSKEELKDFMSIGDPDNNTQVTIWDTM